MYIYHDCIIIYYVGVLYLPAGSHHSNGNLAPFIWHNSHWAIAQVMRSLIHHLGFMKLDVSNCFHIAAKEHLPLSWDIIANQRFSGSYPQSPSVVWGRAACACLSGGHEEGLRLWLWCLPEPWRGWSRAECDLVMGSFCVSSYTF